MIRKIVHIDEEKCNGCGACAAACHEGAIAMVAGKAKLIRDDYCDGLGDCLPACPAGAIEIREREAEAYDEEAVKARMGHSCPSSRPQVISRDHVRLSDGGMESRLSNWPVQIKLAPVKAAVFENSHILVAADCTAYAYASFHDDFIEGKTTLIGCPKLDGVDYTGKLAAILSSNSIASVTVVRMEVPCCGGLENALRRAIAASGKDIPFSVVTISTRGEILR